jgi:hypothetical protein
VLSYFEMPKEDQPPQQIWLDTEALTAHFAMVRERREQKRKRPSEQVEMVPMDDNSDPRIAALRN